MPILGSTATFVSFQPPYWFLGLLSCCFYILLLFWLRPILAVGWNWRVQILAKSSNTGTDSSQAAQRYTPTNSSSQYSQTSSQDTSNVASDTCIQGSRPATTSVAPSQPLPTAVTALPSKDFFVLLGTQAFRWTLELDHIQIQDQSKPESESNFYRDLKRNWVKRRGRFMQWFSCWQLDYCDFVRLKRIAVDRVVAERRELPEDKEYEYSPRAPLARNPPISREEFRGPLNSCDGPCKMSWLPAWIHDCYMPQDSGCLVVIPKKQKRMCPDEIYAWGLKARHAVSAIRVVLIHFLIFAAAFGFWGWWQSRHPDDIQGAAGPITLAVSLCSMFWGTVGILKITRDNEEYA
jgi:hypothetical protein